MLLLTFFVSLLTAVGLGFLVRGRLETRRFSAEVIRVRKFKLG